MEYIEGATNQTIATRMIKSRVAMLNHLPFYGTLLSNLRPVEILDEVHIDTMATNGHVIYYNPDFVSTLTLPELVFINAHEVLHVALGHMWRRGTRNPKLWNYATDYAVNNILKEQIQINSTYMNMPKHALYDERFKNLNAEQIYAILLKENPNGSSSMSGNGNGNGNPNQMPLDNHSQWDSEEAQENSETQQQIWSGRMLNASVKQAGSLAGQLEELIKEIREPRLNWRELIPSTISAEPMDYSFAQIDRRFPGPCLLPDFCDPDMKPGIVVYLVDASGSVSREEHNEIYGEITGAISQFGGKLEGHIGFFDGDVTPIKPFETVEDVLEIPVVGGGGTSFINALNYVAELERTMKINTVIIATDGYAEYPDENPLSVPLIWLMTTDEIAPFGYTAKIEI